MGTDTHSGSWTSTADDNPRRPTTCWLERSLWWCSFPLAWSTLPGFLLLRVWLWLLVWGNVWRLLSNILCLGWTIWTSGGGWVGLTSTGITSLAVYRCWVMTSIEELYSFTCSTPLKDWIKEKKGTHQQARHSSQSMGQTPFFTASAWFITPQHTSL